MTHNESEYPLSVRPIHALKLEGKSRSQSGKTAYVVASPVLFRIDLSATPDGKIMDDDIYPDGLLKDQQEDLQAFLDAWSNGLAQINMAPRLFSTETLVELTNTPQLLDAFCKETALRGRSKAYQTLVDIDQRILEKIASGEIQSVTAVSHPSWRQAAGECETEESIPQLRYLLGVVTHQEKNTEQPFERFTNEKLTDWEETLSSFVADAQDLDEDEVRCFAPLPLNEGLGQGQRMFHAARLGIEVMRYLESRHLCPSDLTAYTRARYIYHLDEHNERIKEPTPRDIFIGVKRPREYNTQFYVIYPTYLSEEESYRLIRDTLLAMGLKWVNFERPILMEPRPDYGKPHTENLLALSQADPLRVSADDETAPPAYALTQGTDNQVVLKEEIQALAQPASLILRKSKSDSAGRACTKPTQPFLRAARLHHIRTQRSGLAPEV